MTGTQDEAERDTTMGSVIVIGAGPQGAASARYLAEAGAEVTVVGPIEPDSHVGHQGPWSGHYDEGRIAATDPLFVPTLIGQRSMRRFEAIEKASGQEFTTPYPQLVLFAGDDADGAAGASDTGRDADALLSNCADFGTSAEVLSADELAARFPALQAPAGQMGIHQDDAVIVNPRSLVLAELTLAVRAGAQRIDDEVTGMTSDADGVRVETRSGRSLTADQVVLATGALTNATGLLPRRIRTDAYGATIVLLEVELPEEYTVPTLMYIDDHYGGGIIAPPLKYPDGRWYVKCASGELMDHPLRTREEFEEWVAMGGTSTEVDYFTDLLASYLPDVTVTGSLVKPCLVGMNVDGNPYVDFVDERIVLVTEGHRGVMMADELGRMAASLVIHGTWLDPIPHEVLRVRWE